jgi:hypothetical protein
MKLLINSEKDINFLNGKFVLQINDDEPSKTLMDMDWGFAKEKRLYLCFANAMVNLYGDYRKMDTFEEYQRYFNDYLFQHLIDRGFTNGGRFHRLLTSKELEYLFTKLKQENY